MCGLRNNDGNLLICHCSYSEVEDGILKEHHSVIA